MVPLFHSVVDYLWLLVLSLISWLEIWHFRWFFQSGNLWGFLDFLFFCFLLLHFCSYTLCFTFHYFGFNYLLFCTWKIIYHWYWTFFPRRTFNAINFPLTNLDMLYFHFIHFKIFSNLSHAFFPFWLICLEEVCLIFKYLGIFSK